MPIRVKYFLGMYCNIYNYAYPLPSRFCLFKCSLTNLSKQTASRTLLLDDNDQLSPSLFKSHGALNPLDPWAWFNNQLKQWETERYEDKVSVGLCRSFLISKSKSLKFPSIFLSKQRNENKKIVTCFKISFMQRNRNNEMTFTKNAYSSHVVNLSDLTNEIMWILLYIPK